VRPSVTYALDQWDENWVLQDLIDSVLAAEDDGGGWVQYTFHDVCTSVCGELDVSSAVLEAFADWLAERGETRNTVVSTVGDAVGGPVAPAVAGPAVPPPGDGNGVVNPDLEIMQNGFPACWQWAPWGDNDATVSIVSPGHSGDHAAQIDVTRWAEGDGKVIPSLDLGSCAPSVSTGQSYTLSAWYKSTTVTQFAIYLRTSTGAWEYWTSSPWFAATTDWTQAVWTTAEVPTGYTGISFGLNIFSVGTLVTDDYSITVATPPTATALTAEPMAMEAEETLPVAPAEPPAEDPVSDPPVEQPPAEDPPAETTESVPGDAEPVPLEATVPEA
jgi:hypothetical protein